MWWGKFIRKLRHKWNNFRHRRALRRAIRRMEDARDLQRK